MMSGLIHIIRPKLVSVRNNIMFDVFDVGRLRTKAVTRHNILKVIVTVLCISIFSLVIHNNFLKQLKHKNSPMMEEKLWMSHIHDRWHPARRSERFPSVQERVKFYMGDYYTPPCNNHKIYYRYNRKQQCTINLSMGDHLSVNSTVLSAPRIELTNWKREPSVDTRYRDLTFCSYAHDQPIVLWNNTLKIQPILEELHIGKSGIKGAYVQDAQQMLRTWTRNWTLNELDLPPLIVKLGDETFGDVHLRSNVPMFVKARRILAGSNESNETNLRKRCRSTFDTRRSILWDFNTRRHWHESHFTRVRRNDIPWKKKENAAVWRGDLNGISMAEMEKEKTFYDGCNLSIRCKLALRYENSEIVDAGFANRTSHQFTEYLRRNRPTIVKTTLSVKEMLMFKAIIILEGNDVATALKWVLYSRSVMLMPIPTMESFAMESLLEPWVHYIPLLPDLSDVEEKVLWISSNDDAARKIAERGTLFMHDFLFHPESKSDDMAVRTEMFRRYSLYFAT